MEKANSKKTAVCVSLFVVIFGVLLSLATVYDLQISKILADVSTGEYFTSNPFGVLFECIGSWPVYLALEVAFAIMFANTFRSGNKALKIAGSVAANIATIIASYVLVTDTVNYINQHFEVESFTESVFAKVVFVFIAIAFAELVILPFTKMDDKTVKALLKLAFIIIFTAALSNIIVNIIKNIMCRPRYRAMQCLGDTEFSNFHRWYQKFTMPEEGEPLYIAMSAGNKVGHDAYRSFPSGHTCAAGMVYNVLALPYILNKYNTKKNRVLLVILSVVITGIVAVSRIVCGAHFFSDVLFGGTITFLCVILGTKIFIRKDFQRV